MMQTVGKTLSVKESARLCGVGRGTINYWIQKKKLYAKRSGRSYSIPINELLHFLKSTGRNIPHELRTVDLQGPIFRSFQPCWEYWDGRDHARGCQNCTVFVNKFEICIATNESSRSHCNTACHECQFYLDVYLPRVQLVHQITLPSAVYKGLYIWAGNRQFAELCGVQERDLPGMGIERIIHPKSLPSVITNIKNRALGDPEVPSTYIVFFNNKRHGKIKAKIGVYPLQEPPGANLVMVEEEAVSAD